MANLLLKHLGKFFFNKFNGNVGSLLSFTWCSFLVSHLKKNMFNSAEILTWRIEIWLNDLEKLEKKYSFYYSEHKCKNVFYIFYIEVLKRKKVGVKTFFFLVQQLIYDLYFRCTIPVQNLSLKKNGLVTVTPGALGALSASLKHLDLSFNKVGNFKN